ncbi:CAZyme family AA9 [Penicillium roqueforti]|uniref:CAZyme family AA9 n=1 Tax=Penicillium roqueforti TaxID=5082 RepID=UPI00190D9CEC|nr:CAZyme family AA9 [Penicillium roqueforti]KAF9238179.1 CAZyme family AA9 [Penicillium roqueforti]KAI2678829.1 CAZyme family AA9 [Penicillium roqueforti]KAI2709362.1 CAZyme family AA9 [Penicillium roqueforti]KAI2725892.1 CAZyme family AA9 [Penicillium roqueforti]KAI3125159.1 CAZyme family AA9 [Penicillium roqueforti]
MYSLLGSALFVSLVAGHGHVTNIVINGVSFDGWDINSYPYTDSPPVVVAWGTPNTANGFIAPDAYTTSDIICHLNATNAKGHAVVAAGDRVFIQWTADWPESHHGPIVDYLASCGTSGCETVDKTTLEFFKIDAVGLIDDTTVPGTWADDQLIAQNSGWMVEIPPNIAPGSYVLRHELIALHSAGTEGGAQNYPQCFNLQITGSGSDQPAGILATDLYNPTDPGILVNIYTSLSTYTIPGPTLYSGAVSITQTTSAITASGTPVTGTGVTTGGTTTTSTSTSKATTTTLVTTTTSTTSATTTNTTSAITTTTTSATTSTSSAGGDGASQTLYGQCGGTGWTGATACASSAACSSMNPWYYQCLPTAA